MKHTPAPWIYRPVPSDSIDGKTSFWVDVEGGAPLADVRTRPNDEHVANARLIAAAPELLEALQDALTSLVLYIVHVDGEEAVSRSQTINKARAAIAKAKAA